MFLNALFSQDKPTQTVDTTFTKDMPTHSCHHRSWSLPGYVYFFHLYLGALGWFYIAVLCGRALAPGAGLRRPGIMSDASFTRRTFACAAQQSRPRAGVGSGVRKTACTPVLQYSQYLQPMQGRLTPAAILEQAHRCLYPDALPTITTEERRARAPPSATFYGYYTAQITSDAYIKVGVNKALYCTVV